MTNTTKREAPLVIGVVGGIASGKSAVAEILTQWGADRFDADAAGHEALAQPAVLNQLVKRWGNDVVDDAGRAIRREIARRVFADTEQGREDLQFLNFITHPWIRAAFQRHRAQSAAPVLLLDAALLLEAQWDSFCDDILFVECSDGIRQQRAATRGWEESEWRAREGTQLPLPEKRDRATQVIDNNGSLDELTQQLAALAPSWGLQPDLD